MALRNMFFTYARYSLLFPVMLALGVAVGIVLPSQLARSIVEPLARTLLQGVMYVTVPYFFFALTITTYEIISLQQMRGFFGILFFALGILYGALLIIGILAILLVPHQSLIPLVQNVETIPPLSFSEIVASVLPSNALRVFSMEKITPLLFLAILLGILTKATLPFKHPLLEIIGGLRSLTIAILQYLLPWFTVISGILMAEKVRSVRDFSFFSHFFSIVIVLASIVIGLGFVIFPLVMKLLRIPISISAWMSRFVPSAIVAFASGNVVASGGILLYADFPDNPRRKIIDTVVSYFFIFGRVGIAIVICVSYLFLYRSFNIETIHILHLLLVAVCSIAFSMVAGVVSLPIVIVGLATLSKIGIISIQELYVIIVPLVPLLSGFAASIDAACCSFLNIFVQHRMAQKYPAPFGTAQG